MRLGLSARKTALQSVVLVIYRLQGQVPVGSPLETQNRFAPNAEPSKIYRERLPPGGQRASGTLWEETKAWESRALENGTWWRSVTGYTVLFLKGGPAECQWSAGGTEQGCLPSCLRTRHGAWTCARGGGVGEGGQSRTA